MTLPVSFSNDKQYAAALNRTRFSRGGSYLLVGKSGHPQRLMAFVQEAIEAGEQCLLVSSRPQSMLAELAFKNGFDLPKASNTNQVGLLKSPTRDELATFGDQGLSQAFRDMIQLSESQNARWVFIDDFSSFLQFHVFETFTTAFRKFVLDAADTETTFFLSLEEPTNYASEQLARFIEDEVTETVLAIDEIGHPFPDKIVGSGSEFSCSLEADFRAIREAAGVTIEEIQKKTRLATAIIKRFEDGLVMRDPSFKAEYIQTILRSYADALGLAQQKVKSAVEASRAGIYRGELHPDYRGGTSTEAKRNHESQQALIFPEIDPLPEPTEWTTAVDSAAEYAWSAVLGKTIKRFVNRKKDDADILAGSRLGSRQHATS